MGVNEEETPIHKDDLLVESGYKVKTALANFTLENISVGYPAGSP